jgi:hypothetical protein
MLVLGISVSGCVSLPDGGAVRSVSVTDTGDGETLVDYTPAGPEPGSTPVPLVDRFLTAMTATPLNTRVAREFLTSSSGRSWVPDRGTVSYGSQQLVKGPGDVVTLRLRDVVELDSRGAWLGDPTGGRGHTYRLRLVREDGEWRISNPPHRLLVPRTHFESQYQQLLLYFFDPSGRVLVPEPVFVPRGRQTPTLLITGLLKGPEPYLRRVERTFLPAGAHLDGLSVPVSREGTAEVPMSREVLGVDERQRNLLFAQVAWTLSQVPGVERVRITVDGTPVGLGGSRESFGVDEWSEFDPAVLWASANPYALRRGRVVSFNRDAEERVSGPLGGLSLGLRSIAVDLLAQRIAGVRADRRVVVESDRDGVPGQLPTRSDVRTVYVGTDVLRPAYDLHGQLWLVDRTAVGARLSVVRSGVARTVEAPGLTGREVTRFVLSRDGTRLVTQVRDGGRDELYVARVEREQNGEVIGLGVPQKLVVDATPARIQDVAWRSPATVAVLARTSPASSRLVLVEVDGSSNTEENLDVDVFSGRAVRLVSSPASRTPLLLGTTGGRFYTLSPGGHWTPARIRAGLRAFTYVG